VHYRTAVSSEGFLLVSNGRQTAVLWWMNGLCLFDPSTTTGTGTTTTNLVMLIITFNNVCYVKTSRGGGGKTEKCTNPSKKRLEEREKNTLEDKSHYDNAVSFSVCLPTSPCVLPHLLHPPPLPFSPPPHHKQPQ